MGFPGGLVVKNSPAMQEMRVQSQSWEDTLKEEIASLQYSCQKNPMDRGTWQAIVPGVAKSWT